MDNSTDKSTVIEIISNYAKSREDTTDSPVDTLYAQLAPVVNKNKDSMDDEFWASAWAIAKSTKATLEIRKAMDDGANLDSADLVVATTVNAEINDFARKYLK